MFCTLGRKTITVITRLLQGTWGWPSDISDSGLSVSLKQPPPPPHDTIRQIKIWLSFKRHSPVNLISDNSECWAPNLGVWIEPLDRSQLQWIRPYKTEYLIEKGITDIHNFFLLKDLNCKICVRTLPTLITSGRKAGCPLRIISGLAVNRIHYCGTVWNGRNNS